MRSAVWIDPGDIVQRLDDLEKGQVKRLEHFITQAQRPDLARGALAAETDVAARTPPPGKPAKVPQAPREAARRRGHGVVAEARGGSVRPSV